MEKKQEVYALEVLRETLQRFYDVVYPFDEAIGCRDLPTLAPNDIDSLRFSMDDFTDATPDFGNVCDAAVQLLKMSDREELRRRLAELKGAIIDFGRAHKAMIDAGKTEYAARCGEANAAYERIRDLAEVTLGVVDGLLTSCRGEQVAATPSVTFEEVAQGVTKRVIVNGVTDTARAQEQAAQAFANRNAPQGGAQVAPQIATTRKRGHHGIGIPTDDAAKEVIKAALDYKKRHKNLSNPNVILWLLNNGDKDIKLRILQDGNNPIDSNSELGKDLGAFYGYSREYRCDKGGQPLKRGGMVFDINKICVKWGSFMSAVKRSKEKNALVQTGESEPKLTYSPLKSISNHKRHKRT